MSDSVAGPEPERTHQHCPWEIFDEQWYASTHMRRRRPGEPTDPLAHYNVVGAANGFGPNPYFDEAWYVSRYADVRTAIRQGVMASGFAHYRGFGHSTHDPHWLFTDSLYRSRRGDLSPEQLAANGLLNGYHHYLIAGQNERSSGSPFFDPEVFAESTGIADRPFSALLSRPELSHARTSRHFDPDWYLAMYSEVVDLIAEGQYLSPLHHYLTNPTPARFAGSPDFDERFYLSRYPDVAASVARRDIRDGYSHFLNFGRFQNHQPSPWFDPLHYRTHRRVAEDMRAGAALTLFDHYLSIGRQLGLTSVRPVHARPVAETHGSEAAGKDIFARMAHMLAASVTDRPGGAPILRFETFDAADPPEVSVVIAAFNQFDLTIQTLMSLAGSTGVRFEVILIDNGSHDEVSRIEAHVAGLRVLRNARNLGFLHATNLGIAAATGRYVLLLNNDVILVPHTVRRAVERLAGDAGIGAVGGKVVRSHGRLQEAGSMLFRDGSALGYGRDGDPAAPEYNFVRDVDYCSGVFLMAPRALLNALGGLDTAFAPAYYEETDLCARIWQHGLRVVYDPSVLIIHLEFGSSRNPDAPRALMQRNRLVFMDRNRAWLAGKQPPDIGLALHGRIAQAGSARRRRRVLVIEDTIPYRHLGSGFVRSADIVDAFVSLDCDVTVFPMNPCIDSPANPRHGFPDTVELMWDRDITRAADFMAERETLYDLVWICRAHNLNRLASVLGGALGPLRHARVVLDTEALASLREAALAELNGRMADKEALLQREMSLAHLAHAVVTVNEAEAETLRGRGLREVHRLGHALTCTPTPRSFAERRDILALGSLYSTLTPNFDGLNWFIEHVWPLVSEAMPEVRLLVAGFVAEGLDLANLLHGPNVVHLGYVPDSFALYDQARMFLAPTRFAAGIPYKVHEAAAHGLPVVATTLLAEQLGWQDGTELLARDPSDAAAFAEAIVTLYGKPALWTKLRAGSLAAMTRDCAPEAFVQTVANLLASGA
jgi:GT2 family glycosyltransferase